MFRGLIFWCRACYTLGYKTNMSDATPTAYHHHSVFRPLIPTRSSASSSTSSARSTPPSSAYSNSHGRMNSSATTSTTTTTTTSSSSSSAYSSSSHSSAIGYTAPSAYTTASAYANAGAVRRRAYSAVGVSGAVAAGSSLSFPKFEVQDDALPPSRRLQDFLDSVVRPRRLLLLSCGVSSLAVFIIHLTGVCFVM
jgi:hypothetical protein